MKPRHAAMAVALTLAAALVLFGDNTPQGSVVDPAERAAAPPKAGVAAPRQPGVAILPLASREILIGHDGGRFGQGADLVFARQDWSPPPAPPPPPPPPTAPPLPFTYIGKSLRDGAYEVYLAQGERSHSLREAAVIDGIYRVDAIRPPVLTLTYLPLNQVQQLNIGVFD
jgi:hypothetical protein